MTSLINAKNERVIASLFTKYDRNGTGKMDVNELNCLLSDLGYNFDSDFTLYCVGAIDTDGSGEITCKEFLAWWLQPEKMKFFSLYEKSPEWFTYSITLFQYYDTNKERSLDMTEFQKLHDDFSNSQYEALKNIVQKDGNKSAKEVISKIDSDNTKHISLYEFMDWIEDNL